MSADDSAEKVREDYLKEYKERFEKADTCTSLDDFLDTLHGNVLCGCDHGCNQWITRNQAKIDLLLRILTKPGSTTDLDRVGRMMPNDAYSIIYHRMFKESVSCVDLANDWKAPTRGYPKGRRNVATKR